MQVYIIRWEGRSNEHLQINASTECIANTNHAIYHEAGKKSKIAAKHPWTKAKIIKAKEYEFKREDQLQKLQIKQQRGDPNEGY